MPRSRLSAGIYLIAIFLSGIVVGAASYRLYSVRTVSSVKEPARPPRSPEEWRKRYVDDLRSRVNLSQQQVASLEQILDNTRAQFKEFHDSTQSQVQAIQNEQVEKIRAILTPEQQPLYEQWRAEREKRRRQSGRKQ